MMSEGEQSLSKKHVGLAFCGPLAQPYPEAPCNAPSIYLTGLLSSLCKHLHSINSIFIHCHGRP